MKVPRGSSGPSCFFVSAVVLFAGLQPFHGLELACYDNNFYVLNFHSLLSTIVSSISLDATLIVVNNRVMSFDY